METPCAQTPYARNMLHNYAALDGMKHWTIPSGVNRPEVEETLQGVEPIQTCVKLDGPVKSWMTTHKIATMFQEVDLLQEGFPVELMDTQRPPIYISVMYSGRKDIGCKFRFTVELLDATKQIIDKKDIEKDMTELEGKGIWQMIDCTFRDYRPGMRIIRVTMTGGMDAKMAGGNYGGPKFMLPTVRFIFTN